MANICNNCKHSSSSINDSENIHCNWWDSDFNGFNTCGRYEKRLSIYTQEHYYDNCAHIDAIMKKFEELNKELKAIKERLNNGGL